MEPLLTRLGYGQEHKPIDLDIEMLSETEALRFFENMVVRYVADDAEKKCAPPLRKPARHQGDHGIRRD